MLKAPQMLAVIYIAAAVMAPANKLIPGALRRGHLIVYQLIVQDPRALEDELFPLPLTRVVAVICHGIGNNLFNPPGMQR